MRAQGRRLITMPSKTKKTETETSNSVERFHKLLADWTEQKRIMAVLFFTPTPRGEDYAWCPPIITEGQPGSTKTSFAYQFARLFGLRCVVASPSMDGAGAFALVPVPDEQGTLGYPAPDYTHEVTDGGLILVDEFTSASEELMPPVHKLCVERMLGRTRLGDRCRIWGACNPASQGTNVQEVPPAMANRVGWLPWDPASVTESQAYMTNPLQRERVSKPLDAEEIEEWVMQQWPKEYAAIAGLWNGFIQTNSQLKDACPNESDPTRSRAWPSMRTWVMAVHALTAARIFHLKPVEQARVVKAFVGDAPWTAWSLWIAKQDLPSAPDLLDGKVTFDFDPSRLDKTITVLSSCVSYLTMERDVAFHRVLAMWHMFEDAGMGTRDFTWPLVKSLAEAGLHRRKATKEEGGAAETAKLSKQAMKVIAALSPFRKNALQASQAA
jgi:hypothetical protein